MSIGIAVAVPDGIALAADTQTTWNQVILKAKDKNTGNEFDLANPIIWLLLAALCTVWVYKAFGNHIGSATHSAIKSDVSKAASLCFWTPIMENAGCNEELRGQHE